MDSELSGYLGDSLDFPQDSQWAQVLDFCATHGDLCDRAHDGKTTFISPLQN